MAEILVSLQMDEESVVTALLHDVVEDTFITLEEVEKEFGSSIAFLVDGVTKISQMNFQNLHHKQSENIRKMIVAMGKDVRVILVKLADRLHNLRTLHHLSKQKQTRIAEETLEVYAPLASRLGMNELKTEMEDLSFKYFNPEVFYFLENKMLESRKDREEYIDAVVSFLNEKLKKHFKTKYAIDARYKNLYSIHRKMTSQNLVFEQIHDILGFRICVENVHQCYEILGLIHSLWKPVPGRFKDFIAMPKTNNYQSLHTTVVGLLGHQIEVQIRTFDMHFLAERGIAAHWLYKTNPSSASAKGVEKTLEKFNWLKDIVSWHQQTSDSSEFLENVKLDLFESEIYVLTPKGDVKELPLNSTPIDFAYSVHTEVGQHLLGAKVNNRQVPLKYKLKSGDMVEVLTSRSQSPAKDWLKYCVTSRARSKIKQFIKTEERKRALEIGEKLLEKGFQKFKITEKAFFSHPKYPQYMKFSGFNSKEDLLISLGFGKLSFKDVFSHFEREESNVKSNVFQETTKNLEKKSASLKKPLVLVEGNDGIMVNFAKCCNPILGDSIKGYVSHKKGIVVHRSECSLLGFIAEERFIDVTWESSKREQASYVAAIEILCVDEPGILSKISEAFSSFSMNILNLNIHKRQDMKASITFTTQVKNVEQLQNLITRLRKIEGVINTSRTFSDS